MPRERIRRKKKVTKDWYNVLATHMFGKAKIAETLSDEPDKLMGRIVEVSMQDLTNDFSKSHIKLLFKIVRVTGREAHTVFVGHSLTTDYVKRMSRKHKSKAGGVFDVITRDGVPARVKPAALAGKRIQSSQKRAIRQIIKEEVEKAAHTHDFDEFIKFILDGELGKEAYKRSKAIYPIKRVEVYKSEVMELPKVKAVTEAREAEAEAAAAAAAAEQEAAEAEAAEAEEAAGEEPEGEEGETPEDEAAAEETEEEEEQEPPEADEEPEEEIEESGDEKPEEPEAEEEDQDEEAAEVEENRKDK
ncbi:MAG TPA: 30S ribosomal protein S3ae [Thermoplasmatales archaeon]|nr:30S ribosomal protein S3ae [Thermoplasmatales archaeon]